MILPRKIQPIFNNWLKGQKQYSWFVKLIIITFINRIPFSLMYGLITDFLDDNDVIVFSQPGKFIDTNKRCYYNTINGTKQDMKAWEKRSIGRLVGISKGITILEKRIK